MSKSMVSVFMLSAIFLFLTGCNSGGGVKTATAEKSQPVPSAETVLSHQKQSGTLSGRWVSSDFVGVSGQLKIEMDQSEGSDFIGKMVFWQSSCPWWKPLTGSVSEAGLVTMTADLGGKCGRLTVQGTYNEGIFIGTYTAEYPDKGEVRLQ